MKNILYLTRNALFEPLGLSQIFPYLKGLAPGFLISLITFEKQLDFAQSLSYSSVQKDIQLFAIRWIPLRFRAKPRPWAPAFAIPQLGVVALWQWRGSRRPDLVHARSYIPAAIAFLLHRLTGVPFIFDMRALWPEELITAGKLRRGSFLHRMLLELERRCLHEASGVVSLTNSAVHFLKATYPRELENQRIVVIPTCADLQRFLPRTSYSTHGTTGYWVYWYSPQWLVSDRMVARILRCCCQNRAYIAARAC